MKEPDLRPGSAGIVPLVGRYQAVQEKLGDRTGIRLSLWGQVAELLPMKARNCINNIVLNAGDMHRKKTPNARQTARDPEVERKPLRSWM